MGQIDITMAGYHPADSIYALACMLIGEGLKERAGTRVTFCFDPNRVESHGGRANDIPKSVEAGDLSMCYFASSHLAHRIPELELFDLPFLVEDRTTVFRALDGELGEIIRAKILAEMGVRVLGYWDNGLRHFTNRFREIRTPEDCKGMLMRSMESDLHQAFYRHLGFETAFFDASELNSGAAQGKFDAQENPLTNTHTFGVHRYHPNITLTGHFLGISLVLVNERHFTSWPSDIQVAIHEAVAAATVVQRRSALDEDDRVSAKLEAEGARLTELSAEERRQFKDAAAPLVAHGRAHLGDDLIDLMLGRQSAIGKPTDLNSSGAS